VNLRYPFCMDKLQSMDEVPVEELPVVLQQPRGQSGPLLELIARRIRTEAESEIETFNLRPRHVIALTLLQLVGEQSQSDLGEALRVDRTNLVGLLNDLEGAGLIERRRSPQDRRRHTVSLTAVGIRRLAELELALADAEQRVLGVLDSDQQATLHALLEQVTANAVVCSEQGALPVEVRP
jgi:DNA-binding MarR family transcriptional regulator